VVGIVLGQRGDLGPNKQVGWRGVRLGCRVYISFRLLFSSLIHLKNWAAEYTFLFVFDSSKK
jgi:hypothetical protein